MDKFDLIIIGGGPAGYLAAERASEKGLKTLLIEKNVLGGVCLNEGCIPTKSILYHIKQFEHAIERNSCLDVPHDLDILSHKEIMEKKNEVVTTLVDGVRLALKRRGVNVVCSEASITREGTTFVIRCAEEQFIGNHVLIATGSVPVIPSIPGIEHGLKDGSIITSKEALSLKSIPKELVIVGGGVIGLEMGTYYNAVGSKVTIIEMLDHIGGDIEEDSSALLKKNLTNKGITFFLSSRVTEVSENMVAIETSGQNKKLSFDKLMFSVGRKPMVDIQGLTELGVQIKNGAIVTNELCQTNVAGIYAAGDVNGKYMLAHVAYREADVAISNIAGYRDTMDYSAIPGVIYTIPEVAFVGMTEQQAKGMGILTEVKKASVNMSGRHMVENGLSEGFCKIVVNEKKGIIIGATIVASYASEMIYAVSLMIQNRIPLESIKRTIFPHPTVCEVIREAIFS